MQSPVLQETLQIASTFLDGLPDRHVGARATAAELRNALGGPLPEEPADPTQVIRHLAAAADAGIVATAGPRYFGFVNGGTLPAALAADWLTSVWDQNAALYPMSPAAAVVEEVAAGWLLELLGLPSHASVGLVTGTQMATFTGLAVGRQEVLRRLGCDITEDGFQKAPVVEVVVGAEAHATIFTALRLLGIGRRQVKSVASDGQGRMRSDDLAAVLESCAGPTLVCTQAGNVNTGASDPLREIARLAHAHRAWLHVDGAFGLWAAASPSLRPQVTGVEEADSWAVDAHKWLNTPYDLGIVITAHPEAHRATMGVHAVYLAGASGGERDGMSWTPEASRRARGFSLYAALRSLGRRGVRDLVERCSRLARQMADRLRQDPSVEILNEVVLNQVLVRFKSAVGGDADALTRAVIVRVQQDGTCWLGGTTWHDQAAMRISVSNWSTTQDDITRAADAILRAAHIEAEAAR